MEWLTPHFALDGRLRMAVQSFVVETPKRTILVDTGIGNKKQGRGVPTWNDRDGPFLDDLKSAGYPIDSIDTVFMTHLHVDHVGFNTTLKDGKWVPTSPRRATLPASGSSTTGRRMRHTNDDQHALVFNDSMKPVVDAGLLDTIGDDARLTDEVSVLSTPGRSPGHLALVIKSGGQEVVIAGDLAHHPCQMAHIDWSSAVDYDGKQSAKTRQDFYARYADDTADPRRPFHRRRRRPRRQGRQRLQAGGMTTMRCSNPTKPALTSKVYDVEDFAAAQELYHSNGWTDGLPVVPPTEAAVEACLEWAGMPPDQLLGIEPVREQPITAEKLAINAVMAGCLPMHFPVVATAWQAMMKEEFLLHGVTSSTGGCAVLVIINGPIRLEIGANAHLQRAGQQRPRHRRRSAAPCGWR